MRILETVIEMLEEMYERIDRRNWRETNRNKPNWRETNRNKPNWRETNRRENRRRRRN